jgi:hypothetical protein
MVTAARLLREIAQFHRQRSGRAERQPPPNLLTKSGFVALAMLLLVLCGVLLTASISAGNAPYLVVLAYSGRQQLEHLASSGLRIVNYGDDLLAAICSEWEIAELRQAGFQPGVLAPIDRSKQLFLVYPQRAANPPATAKGSLVYPYTDDAFILQGPAHEAEAMAMQGADIVRLPNRIAVTARPLPTPLVSPQTSGLAVESLLQAVSPTLLIHHVCKLQDRDELDYCNELGTRYSFATAGLDEAARYLYATYASYAIGVTYDPFIFNSKPMTNVVAELPGNGPGKDHIYIMSAHYDSISPQPYDAAPGADDNASGVAAVLETARILSQHSFPCTIRFVNFAGEEQGLIGSAHYAEQAARRGDIIRGVLNLDMIAYESVPPNDHRVDIHAGTEPLSIGLADALLASISDFQLQLMPQQITTGATWRSDHGSFWSHGFPALLGIEDMDDLNPQYHSTLDTRSRIHPELMTEFTKACLATLARLAAQSYAPPDTPTPLPSMTPTAIATATVAAPCPTATRTRLLYLPMVPPATR